MARRRFVLSGAVLAVALLSLLFLALSQGQRVVAAPPEGIAAAAEPATAAEIPFPEQQNAARAAAWWLVTQHQNDDGGYSAFSTGAGAAPSSVGGTLDAILALAAAGYPLDDPFPTKRYSPLDYLRAHPQAVAEYAAQGGGQAGKLVQALAAANINARDFVGHNFVLSLTQQLSPSGQFASTPYNQALAIQALAVVDAPVPVAATAWLTAQQGASGAWGDGFGTAQNVDATAMALMALVAAGVPAESLTLQEGLNFLESAQLGGGWEYGPGFGANANSTALAVQALSALGENFYEEGTRWTVDGVTPLEALLQWQSQSGAFQALDFVTGELQDNFFATVQALPAVTGRPYPLPSRYESARAGVACLDRLQDEGTGGWEQFAGFGVNAGGTARAIEAIAAFGEDPTALRWTVSSTDTMTNAVEALAALTPAYIAPELGGRIGIVVQGVAAAGAPYNVTDFAGYNLVVSMTNALSPTGEYADTAFGPVAHNEAMLGLLAAGYRPAPTAVAWLLNAQANGDWGFPDADGTSVNVLGQLGLVPPGAIAHLAETQLADGGWNAFAAEANVSSTSEVVLGLASAGRNPYNPRWSKIVSGTFSSPADIALRAQQADGCWLDFFGTTPDPFSITDAIMLLLQDAEWTVWRSYLPVVFDAAE